MKRMKVFMVIAAFLGTIIGASAQTRTVVKVYPKHGTVVRTVSKPRVIVHKRTNYYLADGIWYKAHGKKYVVTAAPRGVKIRTLPKGSKVFYRNGRRLYRYRGIWYKRRGRHYVVVNV
ncbi:DUF6515 family protein [[Muricauda] lutisoli]|uniref:Surface layer protein A domain-containing protein n=1 Tax=[Muricauda] lutisoli TaxID=2816035 RepID=A0ABS3ETN1_9FLAO|nr:DUF6515 family protein [[Muricauda] lutisoli]MBO0329492.1 hypothetical protein [[Muricauda] lutisoli]